MNPTAYLKALEVPEADAQAMSGKGALGHDMFLVADDGNGGRHCAQWGVADNPKHVTTMKADAAKDPSAAIYRRVFGGWMRLEDGNEASR